MNTKSQEIIQNHFFSVQSLTFKAAVKCRTNYFSPSCMVRCVQQDSCEGGHYKCDPQTGEKICNRGFLDPNTNCVTRDVNHKLCPNSDANFCSSSGYCYMNLVKDTSISVPTCCCNQGKIILKVFKSNFFIFQIIFSKKVLVDRIVRIYYHAK